MQIRALLGSYRPLISDATNCPRQKPSLPAASSRVSAARDIEIPKGAENDAGGREVWCRKFISSAVLCWQVMMVFQL